MDAIPSFDGITSDGLCELLPLSPSQSSFLASSNEQAQAANPCWATGSGLDSSLSLGVQLFIPLPFTSEHLVSTYYVPDLSRALGRWQGLSEADNIASSEF